MAGSCLLGFGMRSRPPTCMGAFSFVTAAKNRTTGGVKKSYVPSNLNCYPLQQPFELQPCATTEPCQHRVTATKNGKAAANKQSRKRHTNCILYPCCTPNCTFERASCLVHAHVWPCHACVPRAVGCHASTNHDERCNTHQMSCVARASASTHTHKVPTTTESHSPASISFSQHDPSHSACAM